MIFETARLTIDPANAAAFEQAVAGCAPLFRAAPGCASMRLERECEDRGQYLLRVEWNTIADHVDGFRNSAAFQAWRAAAGPFFVAPPAVTHHETVLAPF